MFDLNTPIEKLPFPVQRLSEDARALWLETYAEVYEVTADETKAELAAWGAIKRVDVLRQLGLKSAGGRTLVMGWAVLFSDADNLDVSETRTYFDETTQTALEYYQTAPLFYEHDGAYGIIGKRTHAEIYPHGIWLEHELDPASLHFAQIVSELESGVLFYSTDSIEHFVQAGYDLEDSHLGLWYLAGCSLTKTPAEPALGPVTFTGVAYALKSAQGKRQASADSATTYSTDEENNSQKGNTMFELSVLASLLGLAETATEEEITAELMRLREIAAAKMNGMNEEDEEAQKSIEDLELVRSALTPEGAEPMTDEQLRAILQSALESLGVEVEMEMAEAPIVATASQKAAGKAVMEAMKKSTKAVRYMPVTVNPNSPNRTGYRSYGNGSNGITPRAKKTVEQAKENFAQGVIAMCKKDSKALKSLGYNEGALGGWLPDREVSATLIELFYADAVLVNAGATIVPMEGIETTQYRKQLNGATARWGAAGQANTPSDPNFGLVELTLREAIASTRLSNRLIKNARSVNIQDVVIRDLEKAIGLLVDLAALRGTGGKPSGSAGREILGVLNTTAVTKTPLSSTGKLPAPQNFVDAYGRMEDANVPSSDTWGVIVHPRTDRLMRNTTDLNGQLLPVERFTQGYNVHKTTQIPINLTSTTGNNTDCSEIYFGDWQYVIMGIGQDIEFVVNDTRYVEERETLIQATMMVDVALSHAEAFQVLTNVRPV